MNRDHVKGGAFVSQSAGSKEVGTYFKFVAELEDGRYVSIFDGVTEYRLTELLTKEVRAGSHLTQNASLLLHAVYCCFTF